PGSGYRRHLKLEMMRLCAPLYAWAALELGLARLQYGGQPTLGLRVGGDLLRVERRIGWYGFEANGAATFTQKRRRKA
ncbi:hypothetical protein L0F63_006881, partial [Massospora cicadina]